MTDAESVFSCFILPENPTNAINFAFYFENCDIVTSNPEEPIADCCKGLPFGIIRQSASTKTDQLP
jgi:hypothetical protein